MTYLSCLCISVDGEERIRRKYKGITIGQWDNRLQDSSFVNWTRLSVIFKALHQVKLGLLAGWLADQQTKCR